MEIEWPAFRFPPINLWVIGPRWNNNDSQQYSCFRIRMQEECQPTRWNDNDSQQYSCFRISMQEESQPTIRYAKHSNKGPVENLKVKTVGKFNRNLQYLFDKHRGL